MPNGPTEQTEKRAEVPAELAVPALERLNAVFKAADQILAENVDVQRDYAEVVRLQPKPADAEIPSMEDFSPRQGTVTELQIAVDMNAVPGDQLNVEELRPTG